MANTSMEANVGAMRDAYHLQMNLRSHRASIEPRNPWTGSALASV